MICEENIADHLSNQEQDSLICNKKNFNCALSESQEQVVVLREKNEIDERKRIDMLSRM